MSRPAPLSSARARSSARAAALPALAIAGALALAGCGDRTPGPLEVSLEPTTPAAAEAGPLALDNCGFDVEITDPPQRVVTIKSTTTELMLALGLEDRIVGAAFLDGPIADDLGGQEVPVLSDRVPGFEAVLDVEPDLVFAGWESNFSSEGAGERDQLTALGVDTYVAPSACKGEGYMPDPLTFDGVFDDFREAGAIFGVPDAAEDLIAQQRARLDAVVPDDRGLTVAWYSSGEDVPYLGAGIGAPQMMMDAVGLTNIAADVHDTWASIGWEEIVAADPDVLVLVESEWNTAANKIEKLESHPATSRMAAVTEQRYLVIPFPAAEAGVRNVDAVVSLADQLADLGTIG